MRIITYTLLSLFMITGFYSCKKIDKDKVPSPDKREFLTSKVWLLYGIKSQNGTDYIDESNCNNRVKWKFPVSGNFSQLEKCDDELYITGTWTLSGDVLSIETSTGTSMTATIKEISSSSMELEIDGSTTYYLK